MTASATDRFRRLLRILPRLADGTPVALEELSTLSGVASDVIIDDLRALTERYDELPGYVEDVGVLFDGNTVRVRTNHFHRPMRLTIAELCALELGLAILQRERTDDDTVRTLRGKLAALIGELPPDHRQGGQRDGALGASGDAATLATLRQALRERRVVRIDYQSGHGDAVSARQVQPHRLTFARGAWYLAGWCERHGSPRVFRVDRMRAAALTDTQSTTTHDDHAMQQLDDGTPFIPPVSAPTVTVRYSTAIARWIAERDGLPVEADGSALRTLPLADREWAIRHVLQYGPDAVVLEPEELRREVVERVLGRIGIMDDR